MIELFAWFIIFDAVFCLTLVCYLIYTKFRWKKSRRKTSKDYRRIFIKEGQYGRFVVSSGFDSFWVQILPKGVKAEIKEYGWASNDDAITVYGPVQGKKNHYDWLHEGPWIEDLENLADKIDAEQENLEKENIEKKKQRTKELLELYSKEWKTE